MKIRKCFKMKLYNGFEDEYKKRHERLWLEMKDMIYKHGGSNYSIYLDKETNNLYGFLELEDETLWSKSAETEICKRWWKYMADIMETNKDNSPVSSDLELMFYLK